MSTVQPITQVQPSVSTLVAQQSVPYQPQYPLSTSILNTFPGINVNTNGTVPQLPKNIISALVSQNALANTQMSQEEKLKYGVVGQAGATLNQLSTPGQFIKPGAGQFAKELLGSTPGLKVGMAISPALMTGEAGISTSTKLLQNSTAQANAVAASVVKSTTDLTNSGTVKVGAAAVQKAGIVLAASFVGADLIGKVFNNPESVAANLSGNGNPIAGAFTNGTFAASLVQTATNGLNGIAASISSIPGGIASSIANVGQSLKSLSIPQDPGQQAFELAEKSFGKLKPNTPNFLGGATNLGESVPAPTNAVTKYLDYRRVAEEERDAVKELVDVRKRFLRNPSDELLAELRESEGKYAAAKQKAVTAYSELQQDNKSESYNLFGNLGAQNLKSLATSATSGLLSTPNPANTGVNSIPGGLSSFANQVIDGKNLVGSITSAAATATGVAAILTQPGKLAGNLVQNFKNTLVSVSGTLGKNITNIGNSLSKVVGDISGGINKLSSIAKLDGNALSGGISSAISSIGNAPGQIKTAILGEKTSAKTNAVVSATLNATLDPKVPPPVFEVVTPTYEPDEYLKAQVGAQIELDKLLAERDILQIKIGRLTDQYVQTGQTRLLDEIKNLGATQDALDLKIAEAQRAYERLITI